MPIGLNNFLLESIPKRKLKFRIGDYFRVILLYTRIEFDLIFQLNLCILKYNEVNSKCTSYSVVTVDEPCTPNQLLQVKNVFAAKI